MLPVRNIFMTTMKRPLSAHLVQRESGGGKAPVFEQNARFRRLVGHPKYGIPYVSQLQQLFAWNLKRDCVYRRDRLLNATWPCCR